MFIEILFSFNKNRLLKNGVNSRLYEKYYKLRLESSKSNIHFSKVIMRISIH